MEWHILAGVGIMAFLTFFRLFSIYCINNKGYNGLTRDTENLRGYFLGLFSIDYFVARLCKRRIREQYDRDTNYCKTQVEYYIRIWNFWNCVISFFFAVGLIVLSCFSEKLSQQLIFVAFGIMLYRTYSRTMEINISFIKDVLDRDKRSSLNRNKRIKLALVSLLEEVFLFIGLYAFLANNYLDSIFGGLHSLILNKFAFDPTIICPAITEKNSNFYEFISGAKIWFSFISIYQVFCAIILLSLSIANYISAPDVEPISFINIPNGVRYIGGFEFWNYKDLRVITIPNTVERIGYGAFQGCCNLTIYCEAENPPRGLNRQVDDDDDFYGVLNYRNNNIAHNGNIYIRINGIRYALNGTEATVAEQNIAIGECVAIPATVQYQGNIYNVIAIGQHAFANCSHLTNITIPASVTNIEDSAFSGCLRLRDINYGGTMADWLNIPKSNNGYCINTSTIHCTDGDIDEYNGW